MLQELKTFHFGGGGLPGFTGNHLTTRLQWGILDPTFLDPKGRFQDLAHAFYRQ
jgi:hypothetical protein